MYNHCIIIRFSLYSKYSNLTAGKGELQYLSEHFSEKSCKPVEESLEVPRTYDKK